MNYQEELEHWMQRATRAEAEVAELKNILDSGKGQSSVSILYDQLSTLQQDVKPLLPLIRTMISESTDHTAIVSQQALAAFLSKHPELKS